MLGLMLCVLLGGCLEPAPEILITAEPASGYAPLQVLLTAHEVGATQPSAVLDYTWTFSDGTTAEGPNVERTFNGKGTLQALLTATDLQGQQATATHSIQLLNRLPEARFAIQPTQPPILLPIEFDASDSRDPDGEVVSYHWDFGDGTTAEGPVAWHAFLVPHRIYQVVLSITDDSGDVNQLARFIEPVGCDH